MFVSFDTEFREVSEHINLHSTELDWVAHVANTQMVRKEEPSQIMLE